MSSYTPIIHMDGVLVIAWWYNECMATSGKEVQKNVRALKRAMDMRGPLKPGDLTLKSREIMATPTKKANKSRDLPALHTKKGVAVRGLI